MGSPIKWWANQGYYNIFRQLSGFRDGEFKLKISQNIRRKNCFFIHDSNKEPLKWFTELVFVLEGMRSSSPFEINVVLPYMRFARQDRKEGDDY